MEHKYRAWDKKDNRMITHEQAFIPLKVCSFGVLRLCATKSGSFYELMPRDRFELMQYTGLTDKNGIEIYEGDILKSVSEVLKVFESPNKVRTGRFSTKYHVVEYRDSSASFCIVGDIIPSIRQKIASKYYEVVGNIHSNPELLEQSK